MITLYRKISPRREKTVQWLDSLYPLNVECCATGFDDDPDTVFTGYFRRLENHKCVIFQFADNTKFRLVHPVYLGTITVFVIATGEKWQYSNYGERRVV